MARGCPKENPYSDIREEDTTDEKPGIMDKVIFFASKEVLTSISMHRCILCFSAAQRVKY